MSAYLKFFELEQSPFEGTAQSQVVLGTKALRDALDTIRNGLDEGIARICVNGGPGLGKTSLARAMPKLLDDSTRVAVVLDPSASWESLRDSIAKQWGLAMRGLPRSGLVEAARDRRLVLVIDRAETASEEFLDRLDVILSYRSESDEPVVQSVLLAELSGGGASQPAPLLWWLDRIQTLQLEFAPLPRDGVESYIQKHLKRAGWRGQKLFSQDAALAIHGYTGGIPGEVSKLCEQLLARAADQHVHAIDVDFVHGFFDEGEADEAADSGTECPDETGAGFEELVLEDEYQPSESAPAAAPTMIDLVETVEQSDAPASLEASSASLEDGEDEVACDDERSRDGGDYEDEGHADDGAYGDEWSDDDDEALEASSLEAADAAWDPEFDAETDPDESMAALEEYLSAPASPEELRSIQGSLLASHGRALAAAAIAALIGGLALAWLSGGEAPTDAVDGERVELAERAGDDPPRSAASTGPAAGVTASGGTLARLRGPVTAEETRVERTAPTPLPVRIAIPEAAPTEPAFAASPDRSAFDDPPESEDDDPEFDEEIFDEDVEDMRPAALRPGPGAGIPSSAE